MKSESFKTPLTKCSSTDFQSFMYQNPLDQVNKNQIMCYKPFAPYVYGKPKFNAQSDGEEHLIHLNQKQQYIQSLQQDQHLKNQKLVESSNPSNNKLYQTQQLQDPKYTSGQHFQLAEYATITYESPKQEINDIISSEAIKCQIHQNQPVKNICISPTCILPLCPICVDEHGQFHKERNQKVAFEPLKNVTESLIENAWSLRNESEKQIKFLQERRINREEGQKKLDDIIELARSQILNSINNIFNEFKNKCYSLQETINSIHEVSLTKKLQDLSHLSNDLFKLQNQLLDPNQLLNYTIALLRSNVLPTISEYLAQGFQERRLQINCQLEEEFFSKLQKEIQKEMMNAVRKQEDKIQQYEEKLNQKDLQKIDNLFANLQDLPKGNQK